MDLIIKLNKNDSQSIKRYELLKQYGLNDDEIVQVNNLLLTNSFKILEIKEHLIWEKDQERINLLKNKNHKILIIWEQEYKNNKEQIIKKCVKFLQEYINE